MADPAWSRASRSARVQRLYAALKRLKQTPCLYPVGDRPGMREMPAEAGHRVFYTVIPDTGRNATAGNVFVLCVFGPGQSRATPPS